MLANCKSCGKEIGKGVREMFVEEVKALEDKIDLLVSDARERDAQSQIRDELIMTNIRLLQERSRPWWRFGK